ncbi:MAG: hypothetical protein ACFFFK_12130 [Candidatus Thorarchaeota archaeon]
MEENILSDEELLDVGSMFRGTATITLVAEIVSAIMLLGSATAYILRDYVSVIQADVAIFLLLVGAMVTLFIFLGAISFFVRFNRRIGRVVIAEGIGEVDLNRPGVKTVVIIYGLAVGFILILGVYGYYLLWVYFLAAQSAASLSFFGMSISIGIFFISFLVQIVITVIGRTATTMIRKVLAEDI